MKAENKYYSLSRFTGYLVLLFTSILCESNLESKPMEVNLAPIATEKPKKIQIHNHVRIDPYFWLNQRDNPEVLDYLKAENEYTKSQLETTQALQDKLFGEIKARIKPDDRSVPFRLGNYYYYDRYEKGLEYPIYCRKKETLDAQEEIILDVNKLAQGHAYMNIPGIAVSPDHTMISYAVDTQGRNLFDIYIKDLATGNLLPDHIKQVDHQMVWSKDNKTLFYTNQDKETLRTHQVYRRQIGSQQIEDQLVFEEEDERFICNLEKSKSKAYIFVTAHSHTTAEVFTLSADNPMGNFVSMFPRTQGLECEVEHFGDYFYILNNDQAPNFKISKTPINDTKRSSWEDLVPHREDVLIEGLEVFSAYLVIQERIAGLTKLRVISSSDQAEHFIPFDDPAYFLTIDNNPEFNEKKIRIHYQSFVTPASTYDYHFETKSFTLLKRDPVPTFDASQYKSERVFAKAKDGTAIPISIVYHKNTKLDGQAPCLMNGYGSYGYSSDAYFSKPVISLLDRGFVFAMAHIRGGKEMGEKWHEQGKMLAKMNTFEDFIACGEYLIAHKYAHESKLYAKGGSAGGLLMGAVMNLRPDLFNGIVANVPFVDVVTTMLDESIPLTVGEYEEWGNPNEKQYYDYMLSYSPYDNVEAKDYPNLFVSAGLHDSQVQYWEPAKWVAKLRKLRTDNNLLLLYTNMDAGHTGASGRFEYNKQLAMQYAFLLYLERISD